MKAQRVYERHCTFILIQVPFTFFLASILAALFTSHTNLRFGPFTTDFVTLVYGFL